MHHLRFVVVLLAAAFVSAAVAFPAGAGFRPKGAEIVELRDACSRHYSNGDGTVTAQISCLPVNRLDACGNWVPVNETDDERKALTFEYQYATGHCAYNGKEYGKTDLGLVKVEREIVLYPASCTERVGWAKFDIASISDSATVTWASCSHCVTYFELSMGLAWTCLDQDPVPAGAKTLYNAIYSSEVCSMGPMGRVFDTSQLGPIAAEHIQHSLARDWVAFGMVGYDYSNIVTKRGWIIGWNTNPREMAPCLWVTYEPPAAVEEPLSCVQPVGFKLEPNPARGGASTLRYNLPGPGPVRVAVLDAAGRVLFRAGSPAGHTTGQVPLDLRALQNGVYFVKIQTDGLEATRKLVLQR